MAAGHAFGQTNKNWFDRGKKGREKAKKQAM